jgi:hypothetical protein
MRESKSRGSPMALAPMALAWLAWTAMLSMMAACSSEGATPDDPNTWRDGQTLTSPVVIAAGTTVTIAPGARVTVGPAVTITVAGTLRAASAAGPHARLAAARADAPWTGLVVERGGTLALDGVDLVDLSTALDVRAGDASARYDHGTIRGVSAPFMLERGSALDTTHATVVAAAEASGIGGDLTARYLDYEKAGASAGLQTNDAFATLLLSDSTFHGTADAGGDFIVAVGAKHLRVEYSTITNAHCAFHFDSVEQFEIDHVTAGAASPTDAGGLNFYGAMLYGSGDGPSVITHSNFMNSEYNLDHTLESNGPLAITDTFTTGHDNLDGVTWTPAAGPVSDARPR